MVHFQEITKQEFLSEYWQKKPIVIRNALPNFRPALTADELAGLAMEEEIESRLVMETPQKAPYWQLKRGPFVERDFARLAKTHWTLLVQGVDRFVPEVAALCEHFDFIPQWRFDDVMISYAVEQGSVGPHYDNYDVFLYQAQGRRKWSLTTKNCDESNYLKEVELRIMKEFLVEEEYILEEGDMLYLPPHVGHYGISLSEDCMTYSFGYRSYQGQELLDSFAEYLAENKQSTLLYKDPNWFATEGSTEVPKQAWLNAKKLLSDILDDEQQLQAWFGCFVTRLDQQAEVLLPHPSEEDSLDQQSFSKELAKGSGLIRNNLCRFAYQIQNDNSLALFINGCQWDVEQVSRELVQMLANSRMLTREMLAPFLSKQQDQSFLFELWSLQWLEFDD
ncbi:50S ribosomal protein L16 arginine hydroxylase [Legionella massiliensis]|uniref:50S ribosomal protein L16 arginine hydroxylase n=1 Tax=Legionella massiliensis TaxID=1034943 RepID=A0A078L4V4_9GAMM|nr:cupin domain-containing protein [Legionella massiliensis]CDZ79109.1 50S ribosomal protein L16 arginine hydroxylase [Legionella massiliensis]CEE14847.1 50S ribosomal protein L16 arginine hydroxylase [Legionella massiliensis]